MSVFMPILHCFVYYNCKPKIIHNLVESYVLFSGNFQDFRPAGSISNNLKEPSEEVRGGIRLYRNFATKNRWSEHQMIFVNSRKPDIPSQGI